MQESHPVELTKEQAATIGKLRREYFTKPHKMMRRREELRTQGEKVEPAIPMTDPEMLARGSAILLELTQPGTSRAVRKALRAELISLSYALSSDH